MQLDIQGIVDRHSDPTPRKIASKFLALSKEKNIVDSSQVYRKI